MNIRVEYEHTDVAKILSEMIKHPNKEELVKLFTPLVCDHSDAVQRLFKLNIPGNKLPKVLSNGTICKVPVASLGYDANKELIRERFADQDDNVPVKIIEFRGYHEYANYRIEYTNILDDGEMVTETARVKFAEITEIEEF